MNGFIGGCFILVTVADFSGRTTHELQYMMI